MHDHRQTASLYCSEFKIKEKFQAPPLFGMPFSVHARLRVMEIQTSDVRLRMGNNEKRSGAKVLYKSIAMEGNWHITNAWLQSSYQDY